MAPATRWIADGAPALHIRRSLVFAKRFFYVSAGF